MVSNATYAVLSRIHFAASHAHMSGRGGSQKVTSDDKGEGGVKIPPKNDYVIYEQPLTVQHARTHLCTYFHKPVFQPLSEMKGPDHPKL